MCKLRQIRYNDDRSTNGLRRQMHPPDPLITVSPDFLSGAPVFTGTRVPVQNLFDYLEGGEPLAEFLEDFPNVSREHAIAVLEQAKSALVAAAE
jgi:uncharacterized protein (DUF433 family)